ncbi:MAG: N-acetylmuramic acid 6-phosphate phosphatase [Gammaproteobacteria bacterium]|nr:N-acetylmuramic acid 6-phosphate phosphatase [Gammaproteobacteria bacterium]
MHRRYSSVLFDLDGTLLDTAPDLAYALNRVRAEEGLDALPCEHVRPQVSNGARALVLLGFGGDERHPRFEVRRQRLLAVYRDNLCRETRLFAGMELVLSTIEGSGRRWGVVTNKPGWLTEPLLDALGLFDRAACVVSGDTVTRRKPHPDPLLHAAQLAATAPADCVYVGDARCDAEAARAAGMGMLAAAFGYIDATEDPARWGADAVIVSPTQILEWIET